MVRSGFGPPGCGRSIAGEARPEASSASVGPPIVPCVSISMVSQEEAGREFIATMSSHVIACEVSAVPASSSRSARKSPTS